MDRHSALQIMKIASGKIFTVSVAVERYIHIKMLYQFFSSKQNLNKSFPINVSLIFDRAFSMCLSWMISGYALFRDREYLEDLPLISLQIFVRSIE